MKNIIFKIILLSAICIIPCTVFSASKAIAHPGFYGDLAFYLLAVIGTSVMVLALSKLLGLLSFMTKMRKLGIHTNDEITQYLAEQSTQQISWWTRLQHMMTDTVPIEKEEEILFDHEYDGIRELDNNLPPWWVYGFYLTIGIAIFYIGFFHFSSYAMSSQELYALEMEEAQEGVDRYLAQQANSVDESNVVALIEADDLAAGKAIFNTNCVACHLETAAGAPGSVGPNLTDQYWLHGGGIKNIFKTIKHGVPDKGMIAWKTQMRPADIHKVASYILSLQGTNPPNGKEPQGEIWTEDTDSTVLKQPSGQVMGMK